MDKEKLFLKLLYKKLERYPEWLRYDLKQDMLYDFRAYYRE